MGARRTILIVDDVAMFRELGSIFLARTGRVVTACNGKEGLEIAQRVKPDLVITDLVMPEMDGAQLCREIKNDPQLCETPVIVMVGSDDPQSRGLAVRAGADDLLPKPLSRVSLVAAVSRFLAYEHVRGLPRVEVEEPVRITVQDVSSWGLVRNLSRGGAFVETERQLDPWTEVDLDFQLPERGTEVHPSAQVVWNRSPNGLPPGIGLRFLEVEGEVARWLEDFVWEHTLVERSGRGHS